MSTQIKEIRFYEGRKHQIHKRKSGTSIKLLSKDEIYERQQERRANRAEEIRENEELILYIDWISELQRRSGLSNEAFARRIGVSAQTIKLWKRKSGHLPSERSFQNLCKFERALSIPVRIKNFRVKTILKGKRNVSK